MANHYKSKYAKAKQSTKAFFIGLGIVTITFVVLILFAVFQPFQIRDYSGMNRISAIDLFQQERNDLQVQTKDYYVYFYSPTCAGCAEVKPDVLAYANYSRNGKNNRIQIYIVNTDLAINSSIIKDCTTSPDPNCRTTNIFPNGANDTSSIKVATTPSMIKISNGRVSGSNWVTVSAIKTELNNAMTTNGTLALPVDFGRKNHAFDF